MHPVHVCACMYVCMYVCMHACMHIPFHPLPVIPIPSHPEASLHHRRELKMGGQLLGVVAFVESLGVRKTTKSRMEDNVRCHMTSAKQLQEPPLRPEAAVALLSIWDIH